MTVSSLSVVLIGATGGIGAATASELLRCGARVLLVARSRPALARLARALSEYGSPGQVEALSADVTTSAGLRDIVDVAQSRRANALVNCAGLPCFGPLHEADDQQIAQVLATNLLAPIQLTRALLPHLSTQPNARILNVGSALGGIGVPGFSVYCASKFGLRGFTESLRRELAGTSVRVQYLAPRITRTVFNDERVDAFNRATGTRSDPPHAVATKIVGMLHDGSAIRSLGAVERMAARVNGLAPRLLDRAFKRHRAALVRTSRVPPCPVSEES